jgi:hypothetical protein
VLVNSPHVCCEVDVSPELNVTVIFSVTIPAIGFRLSAVIVHMGFEE